MSIWVTFISAIAGAIALACTATSSCTTCQNATVQCSTPAGVAGQCQDTDCTNCGYCQWTQNTPQGQKNYKVPIGCPGLQCSGGGDLRMPGYPGFGSASYPLAAQLRPGTDEYLMGSFPFTTAGPTVAGLGLAQLALGVIDDQYQNGVTVHNATLNINQNGRGWSGGHFALSNNTTKGLTTFMVTFHVTDTAGETLQFSNVVDGYLTQSPLAAGQSFDVDARTAGSFQFPVAGVSASLSYLEFADGSLFGKESGAIYAKLGKERAQAIGYAQMLTARLEHGTPEAEIAAGLSVVESDEPGVRTAKTILRDSLQENVSTLSRAVRRMAKLPISTR